MVEKLFDAVNKKDYSNLKRMLSSGVGIDICDEEGWTPLIYAVNSVYGPDAEMVEFLLQHGADVNIVEPDKQFTALLYAANMQLTDIVRILLHAGAEVNVQEAWGNTPLGRALGRANPDVEIVKMLLEHGADPDIKNNYGNSPRDGLVHSKSKEILELFNN